jgi:hypothetical protein
MKRILTIILTLFTIAIFSQSKLNYVEVSKSLLTNIKEKKSFDKEVSILSKTNLDDLINNLKTDKQKIAFWVNVYNAYIQISLTENPKLYEDRGKFFAEKRIQIAGETLSFADIEHGIIRKSKIEWSWGYLRKWFPPKWQRELRVSDVDWRIHFALNCGAKDCPPVAIFSAENLDKELDFMSKNYLEEQTSYNVDTKTAKSVSLFSWFRADFGGICGARKILAEYGITPEEPKDLEFKNYDWTLSLGNFRNLPNL